MSDDEGSFHEDPNEEDEEIQDDADEDEQPARKKQRTDGGGQNTFDYRKFLDDEAEVSDDDDDEDDEAREDFEFDEGEGFVVDDVENSGPGFGTQNALDRMREERDVQKIAQAIEQRHHDYVREEVNEEELGRSGIAQQARQPSVQDPRLWTVKCTPGMEKQFVTQLMHKFIVKQQENTPLQIFSVTFSEHLKGYIYVEAYKEAHVKEALEHMDGIFYFKVALVPLKEMVSVLSVPKKKVNLPKGSWVKVKRGLYKGDVAQVFDYDEASSMVYVKIIPRLDLQKLRDRRRRTDDEEDYEDEDEEEQNQLTTGGFGSRRRFRKRKRRQEGPKPPPRLFNANEVHQILGDGAVEVFYESGSGERYDRFDGNLYKDGLLHKKLAVRMLEVEGVVPSFEEIQKFQGSKEDDEDDELTQREKQERIVLEQTRKLQVKRKILFQKNDNVVVVEGELKNLVGRVHSVDGDLVNVIPRDFKMTETLPVPRAFLQKFFRTGDHVKVETGTFEGETGLIVKIADNVAVLISDVSRREIKVLTSDIRECAEVSTGLKFGEFMLYDLVQLDLNTVGVITHIEADSAQILDMHGKSRSVKIQGIRSKKDSRRAFGRDSDGSAIGSGDMVSVVKGEFKGEKGVIKHIFRTFIFVHSKTRQQNNGMLVTHIKNCRLQGISKNKQQMAHGNERNGPLYSARGQYGFGRKAGKRRNDELMHKNVQITKGPWKSYIGIVKDTDDTHVIVELQTNAKRVRIPREQILCTDNISRGGSSSSKDDYDMSRTPHPGMTPLHPGSMTPRNMGTPMTPSHDPFNASAVMTPLHTPAASNYNDDEDDEEEEKEPVRKEKERPQQQKPTIRGGVLMEAPSPAARTPFPVEVPHTPAADFPAAPRTPGATPAPGSLTDYQIPSSAFATRTPFTPMAPLPQTPRTPGGGVGGERNNPMLMMPPRTPAGDAATELLAASTPRMDLLTSLVPAPRTPGGNALLDIDGVSTNSSQRGGLSGMNIGGNTPIGGLQSVPATPNLRMMTPSTPGPSGGSGFVPSTPATPRTPSTPGGINLPSTPLTPGGLGNFAGAPPTPGGNAFNDDDIDSEEVTFFPGMEVNFDDSYKAGSFANLVGVVIEVNGNVCTVILKSQPSDPPVKLNGTFLTPVKPEKKGDKVIALKGDKKGQKGTLIAVNAGRDGSFDGIVRLETESEICVLKMALLAKLNQQ